MRRVPCDLCGSSEAAVLFIQGDSPASDGEGSFRVVECRVCGLIYLNPRPEGSELAAYYPQEYYDDLGRAVAGRHRGSSAWRRVRRSVRRSLLERFYHYPPPAGGSPGSGNSLVSALKTAWLHAERWRLRMGGREAAIIPFAGEGRLLDVGCATGKDLQPLKEMGWDVTGVEFSAKAASVARARLGCEILVGDFEKVPLADGCFDVVRFSHTLEHVPSPRRALVRAHQILRPDGQLWIEVPNAASLERWLFGRHWIHWDLPRHLYHFTPTTLARLLTCTGFRPVKIKCDGRTLFFAESVSNASEYWLGIRMRRSKLLSAMARPLVYALGGMNRGAILTIHAEKDALGGPAMSAQ